jgi:hypothetical protein
MWRGGGWRGAATWRRAVVGAPRNATAGLSTCQPDGAPVLLEEDATVTKLLFVRLITKDRKIVVCLFVG